MSNQQRNYKKNPDLLPNLVNIQVSSELATPLKKIMTETTCYLNDLSMYLNEDVFRGLLNLLDDPSSTKKHFDKMLFTYLDGISREGNIIESAEVVLLNNMNSLLISCIEYLKTKSGKEDES